MKEKLNHLIIYHQYINLDQWLSRAQLSCSLVHKLFLDANIYHIDMSHKNYLFMFTAKTLG